MRLQARFIQLPLQYDADRLALEGVRAKPHHLLSQPLRHFWWRFITLEGWRDGVHGLRLSALMARFEFEKYRLLGRRQRAGSA